MCFWTENNKKKLLPAIIYLNEKPIKRPNLFLLVCKTNFILCLKNSYPLNTNRE